MGVGDGDDGVDVAASMAALAEAAALHRGAPLGPSGVRPDAVCLGMDWGAVAVFACADSCGLCDEEVVVVQPPL
jgi:hypothetical protein